MFSFALNENKLNAFVTFGKPLIVCNLELAGSVYYLSLKKFCDSIQQPRSAYPYGVSVTDGLVFNFSVIRYPEFFDRSVACAHSILDAAAFKSRARRA